MDIIVEVAGWSAEGLRCPDHKVSFIKDKDRQDIFPISLIQMPNGTGKTTTLGLLRAALSGSAQNWSADQVQSLRKRNFQSSSGQFQVTLHYNTKRLTITMDFDFDDGIVTYSTTLPGGNKEGFRPPRDVMKFFQANFVSFFVFDGELAEQLLNQSYTQAQNVIEDLFQLRLFSGMTNSIDDYWKEKISQVGGVIEKRGLTRRQNKVNSLQELLKKRKKEQNELSTEYKKTEKELKKKNELVKEEITKHEEIKAQLQQTEDKLKEAQRDLDSSAKDVLDDMRNPHSLSSSFAARMITLKDRLDRVKLPESAAREFFEELADEAECICGRLIDDDTIRAHIKSRARRYMGSDDVSLLNQLKGEVANLVGTETDSHEVELKQKISVLNKARRQEENAKNARDEVQNEAIEDDPKLEKVAQEISNLEEKFRRLKNDLSKFQDTDATRGDQYTYGIQVLERRLENAEQQLAKATDTVELKDKSNLLTKIIEKAYEKAKQGISVDLCKEANKRIEGLMPSNAIRIQKITQSLVLRGQEAGSVGETLSIGYAFLATLFNRTEHQLPFIVDSPANPIDLEVRAKVAELVPKLSHQFIAFTISSEREGFLPSLEAASDNGDIQYITMFRKDMQPDDDFNGEHAKDSIDGWCVHGKTYFERFQLNEEEPINAI